MNTKILAMTAAVLAISIGAASAQVANTTRQAGAALFDQGGVFDPSRMDLAAPSVDRPSNQLTTARTSDEPRTIRSAIENRTGIPSDTRNEGGLGLFDRVSK